MTTVPDQDDEPAEITSTGIRALHVAVAVTMAGVASIFPLLAEFERRYELSTASLGWIAGMSFASALVTQLTLSRYADRGYSNLLLRAGLAAGALGLLWFAAATELWQFVLARALLGVAVGAVLPAARRAVLVTAADNPGERLGILYAWYLSGFVIGPPIAGLLTVATDVRLPFLLYGLGTAAVWVYAMRTLRVPEVRRDDSNGLPFDNRVLRRLVRRRTVVAAVLVIVSFRFSVGVFEPLWATHLDRLGASTLLITFTLTMFALPMLLVARRAGRLSDQLGPRLTSVVSAAATVPIMFVYGHVTGLAWIIILVIPHGLLEAIQSPGTQAALAEAAPDEDTAAAQGLGEAAGSAAAAIGAFTAAPIYAAFGAAWAWGIGGATMAALLIVSAILDPVRGPDRSRRRIRVQRPT